MLNQGIYIHQPMPAYGTPYQPVPGIMNSPIIGIGVNMLASAAYNAGYIPHMPLYTNNGNFLQAQSARYHSALMTQAAQVGAYQDAARAARIATGAIIASGRDPSGHAEMFRQQYMSIGGAIVPMLAFSQEGRTSMDNMLAGLSAVPISMALQHANRDKIDPNTGLRGLDMRQTLAPIVEAFTDDVVPQLTKKTYSVTGSDIGQVIAFSQSRGYGVNLSSPLSDRRVRNLINRGLLSPDFAGRATGDAYRRAQEIAIERHGVMITDEDLGEVLDDTSPTTRRDRQDFQQNLDDSRAAARGRSEALLAGLEEDPNQGLANAAAGAWSTRKIIERAGELKQDVRTRLKVAAYLDEGITGSTLAPEIATMLNDAVRVVDDDKKYAATAFGKLSSEQQQSVLDSLESGKSTKEFMRRVTTDKDLEHVLKSNVLHDTIQGPFGAPPTRDELDDAKAEAYADALGENIKDIVNVNSAIRNYLKEVGESQEDSLALLVDLDLSPSPSSYSSKNAVMQAQQLLSRAADAGYSSQQLRALTQRSTALAGQLGYVEAGAKGVSLQRDALTISQIIEQDNLLAGRDYGTSTYQDQANKISTAKAFFGQSDHAARMAVISRLVDSGAFSPEQTEAYKKLLERADNRSSTREDYELMESPDFTTRIAQQSGENFNVITEMLMQTSRNEEAITQQGLDGSQAQIFGRRKMLFNQARVVDFSTALSAKYRGADPSELGKILRNLADEVIDSPTTDKVGSAAEFAAGEYLYGLQERADGGDTDAAALYKTLSGGLDPEAATKKLARDIESLLNTAADAEGQGSVTNLRMALSDANVKGSAANVIRTREEDLKIKDEAKRLISRMSDGGVKGITKEMLQVAVKAESGALGLHEDPSMFKTVVAGMGVDLGGVTQERFNQLVDGMDEFLGTQSEALIERAQQVYGAEVGSVDDIRERIKSSGGKVDEKLATLLEDYEKRETMLDSLIEQYDPEATKDVEANGPQKPTGDGNAVFNNAKIYLRGKLLVDEANSENEGSPETMRSGGSLKVPDTGK
jgi:hypothetical protein